ncbi:MAG: hypothetical protein A2516_10055 [Alphaproteobacteria bacterium RIFOXYD12_FULL_60_8]|nr:MAG: hypothetical protein A2516_10055 [Alphaproteobacteria bacterium RIFOXYD12_FULL_60_8]
MFAVLTNRFPEGVQYQLGRDPAPLIYIRSVLLSKGWGLAWEHRFTYANGHCIDLGPDEDSNLRPIVVQS